MLYNFLIVMEMISFGVLLFFAILYLTEKLFVNKQTKILKKTQPYAVDEEKNITPTKATKEIFNFLNDPELRANNSISTVPNLNPVEEGNWSDYRRIRSANHIMTYREQGAVPMEFYELTGDYAILLSGAKKILLKQLTLKPQEAIELQDQRQAAVDKNDGIIEMFRGYSWRIVGAFGENINPNAGEAKCSYFQTLSKINNTSDDLLNSDLPMSILNGNKYDYYDMQAMNTDAKAPESQQILYALYIGGTWYCYVGRLLQEEEIEKMYIT